jgi:hypothetical protein
MNIQNNIDFANRVKPSEYGHDLETQMIHAYPDFCRDCGQQNCTCDPILPKTVGRIAKEVSFDSGLFDISSLLMRPEIARREFRVS